jgi:hypothetical protein
MAFALLNLNTILGLFSDNRQGFVAELGHIDGFGYQISEDGADVAGSSVQVKEMDGTSGLGQKVNQGFVKDLGHDHGFGLQISEDRADATAFPIVVQDLGEISGFGQKLSDSVAFLVPGSKDADTMDADHTNTSLVKPLGGIQHFGSGGGPGLRLDVPEVKFQGLASFDHAGAVQRSEELSVGSMVKSLEVVRRFGAGGGPGPRSEVELGASPVRLPSLVQHFASRGGPRLRSGLQGWQPTLGLELSEFAVIQRLRRLGAGAALCLFAFAAFCRLNRRSKDADVHFQFILGSGCPN